MATPLKDSLDYFPLDCNFFEDKTIKGLRVRFQNDGIAVYLYLLCVIYRSDGYYTELDEDLLLDVTDTAHISEEEAREIVNHLIRRKLFDRGMAEREKILTSRAIQMRYQKGKIRTGNRRKVKVKSEYWLLNEQETDQWIDVVKRDRPHSYDDKELSAEQRKDAAIKQPELSTNGDNAQSESKEKVVKKVKNKEVEKKSYADAVLLSEEEYAKLLSEFTEQFVKKCIETLNNYKLSSGHKYKSDYYAIRSWVISEVNKRYPKLAIRKEECSSKSSGDLFSNPWSDENG